MPLHQVVTLELLFLVGNDPRHPEQKPGPEVFHPEVGVAPGRGVELTRVEMRMGQPVLRWRVRTSEVRMRREMGPRWRPGNPGPVGRKEVAEARGRMTEDRI